MLLYQWFPKWTRYIIVLIGLALLGTYIAEPIFVWMKIYDVNTWKKTYSLPIYIAMGIGVKALAQFLLSVQCKVQPKEKRNKREGL